MNRRERRLAAKRARRAGTSTGHPGAPPSALAAALAEATALHHADRLREAESAYRKILAQTPQQPEALHQLGLLLAGTGRRDDGVAMIEQAVAVRPRYAEARFNLGTVLHSFGETGRAVEQYRAALDIQPDFADALFNLGTAAIDLGRPAEAEDAFRRLLKRVPDHALALNALGVALNEQDQPDEADEAFRAAIEADPGCADAYINLGNSLYEQGRSDEAAAQYRTANDVRPSDAARIKAATVLPVIMGTEDEVAAARARFDAGVARLARQKLHVADPLAELGMTGFYLAYHGVNDRPSQEALGRLMLESCPSLAFEAPHCAGKTARPAGARFKIGFISRHFSNHTIGRLQRGLIQHLDRGTFEVTVLRWPQPADEIGDQIAASADRLIELPMTLEGAREAIAAEQLDVLYYTDVGMEPFTYFLSFARLAPVQCVFWGHPMTTGSPTIDYFLSGQDLEVDGGDDHYTERLVRLATPPVCYQRPALPAVPKTRSAFGLDDETHVYLCPQTLFKFHPSFDPLIKSILEHDPEGELVLIEGKHPHWQELLLARFRSSIGAAADRIRFLPRQGYDDFLSLLATADVILDPPLYGGGNSTLEAFAVGTPVVTLPGAFLRDRISYAWCGKMGVEDGVAASREDYVRLAVALGTDRGARDAYAARLAERTGGLFDDLGAVRTFEGFLLDLIGGTCSEPR